MALVFFDNGDNQVTRIFYKYDELTDEQKNGGIETEIPEEPVLDGFYSELYLLNDVYEWKSIQIPKQELNLLKEENDLLRQENELLKQQIAELVV